jgi:phospholipid/cholesterol/gamma-HCH transport system substrate-binding protein
MAEERSLEVKVGALILLALGILVAFFAILGGISFEKTYTVSVDFDNPGGLRAGAAVRVAGVKVGSVQSLEFLGGGRDPRSGARRPLVRARTSIEQRYADAIHEDADFYVTTQGVLGEPFLAIEPGSPERPPLRDRAEVKGIDPPRIDLFLAKAYELLDTTVTGIRDNRALIGEIATNAAGVLRGINEVVTTNHGRVDRILANAEAVSEEARELTHDARVNLVDNPKALHAIDTIDKLTTEIHDDAGPMLKDARDALANLDRLSATVGAPGEQEQLRKTLSDLAQLAERANSTVADAQAIVSHVKKGEGTVGALLMDEEIYDDMQEMVRDLKHHPWKFLWRE